MAASGYLAGWRLFEFLFCGVTSVSIKKLVTIKTFEFFSQLSYVTPFTTTFNFQMHVRGKMHLEAVCHL